MKIVVAGASGFVGRALVQALGAAGHEVQSLVRRAARAKGEVSWDPAAGVLDTAALGEVDAVVNLAGENIAAGRWSVARRERILRSRVEATRTLVLAVARMERKPRVFVNASAVGIYGDRGDEVLTEESAMGQGFLPEVCLAWETHAEGATRLGVRTVLLRFGVVLAPDGGALARLLPVFRLCLGGKLGSGRQWMSWVSREDAIGAVSHVLCDERCVGPVNVVAPEAVTNAAFTTALGRAVHRPAIFTVPAFALRLGFGRMAVETLLASTRVSPQRLQDTGYVFQHPTLESALRGVG